MTRLDTVLDQLRAARAYTLRLLDQTPQADWYRMPEPAVTHVAWQVGHLAIAEYRLGLERLRGSQPADAELVGESYVRLFGRLSTPSGYAASYPAPDALLATLARVHEQVMAEAGQLNELELDLPVGGPPHPEFTTRVGALTWCARHEMLHAGQIGLLRRLLGCEPVW